ncbi:MAG: PEP-CTERM sorting domain-containing protein [Phycisphaerae bacterium]|nr:PEP-CTERM sorting domain-containing protein [Phycisphaerae bacterium]
MRIRIAVALTLCAWATHGVSPAVASPFNHGDFPSPAPGGVDFLQVTEDSTTGTPPIFEEPIRAGDKLIFQPSAFAAFGFGGTSDVMSGVLTMNIRAAAGEFLDYLVLREQADYSLLGGGTAATFASIFSQVTVEDVTPGGHGLFGGPMSFSPSSSFTLPGSQFGVAEGLLVIDLSGLGISEVKLTIDNEVSVGSEAGTTALIQKKELEILHTSEYVPEPATATLLAFGALVMRRRRRR